MGRVGVGAGSFWYFRWLLSVFCFFLGKRGRSHRSVRSLDDNMQVSHAGGTDLPSSICVLPGVLEGRRPTEQEDFAALLGNRPQWTGFVPVPPGNGGKSR